MSSEFLKSMRNGELVEENYELEIELKTENYEIWINNLFMFSKTNNDTLMTNLNTDIFSNSTFRILSKMISKMIVFNDELKDEIKGLKNNIDNLENHVETLRTDVDNLMTENYFLSKEEDRHIEN